MKIYTKTGDKGKTSLFGGSRVSKSHERIDAYGTIDELNSHMGMLRDLDPEEKRKPFLISIQENLFVIGSMLASEKKDSKIPTLAPSSVEGLEKGIDELNEALPPMTNFILPGGHQAVSQAHVSRCVCRRAERGVVALQNTVPVDENIIIYLNRLSDYLFILSRKIGQELSIKETPWKPKT